MITGIVRSEDVSTNYPNYDKYIEAAAQVNLETGFMI
jgi:hypothetical protein